MRSAGLPIEVLIEYVSQFQQSDRTIEARKAILNEQREILAAKIAELQKTLDLLDHKIAVKEKDGYNLQSDHRADPCSGSHHRLLASNHPHTAITNH